MKLLNGKEQRASSKMYGFEGGYALSVNGKFSSITDADPLAVAAGYGLGTAKRVLAEVKEAVR